MSSSDYLSLTEADVRNNPQLDQATLMNLVLSRPDLRAAVRQHPNCYPALAEWIDGALSAEQQNIDQRPPSQASGSEGNRKASTATMQWALVMPFVLAGLAALAVVTVFIPAFVSDFEGDRSSHFMWELWPPLRGAVLPLTIISMVLSLTSVLLAVISIFIRVKPLQVTGAITATSAGLAGVVTYIVFFTQLPKLTGEYTSVSFDPAAGSFIGLVAFSLLLIAGGFAVPFAFTHRDRSQQIAAFSNRGRSEHAQPHRGAPKRQPLWMPYVVVGLAALAFVMTLLPATSSAINNSRNAGYMLAFIGGVQILTVLSLTLLIVAIALPLIAASVRSKSLMLVYPLSSVAAGTMGLFTYIVLFLQMAMVNRVGAEFLRVLGGETRDSGGSYGFDSDDYGDSYADSSLSGDKIEFSFDPTFGSIAGMIIFSLLIIAGVVAIVLEILGARRTQWSANSESSGQLQADLPSKPLSPLEREGGESTTVRVE